MASRDSQTALLTKLVTLFYFYPAYHEYIYLGLFLGEALFCLEGRAYSNLFFFFFNKTC